MYEFELTATDKEGLQGHDTTRVHVVLPGSNEVVFENLSWSCPMGCSVVINNIFSNAPREGFSIFYRDLLTTTWTPLSEKYEYEIVNNENLVIYSWGEESGKVDIKITY